MEPGPALASLSLGAPNTFKRVKPTPPPGAPGEMGEVRLKGSSGLCLALSSASAGAGGGEREPRLADCTKSDFQKMYGQSINKPHVEGLPEEEQPKPDSYKIKGKKHGPNRCLEVGAALPKPDPYSPTERALSLRTCRYGAPEQGWHFVLDETAGVGAAAGPVLTKVKSRLAGAAGELCLDVQGAGGAGGAAEAVRRGARLVVAPCVFGSQTQLFYFPGQTVSHARAGSSDSGGGAVPPLFPVHDTAAVEFDGKVDAAYVAETCPGVGGIGNGEFLYDKCLGSACLDYMDCGSCTADPACGWCGQETPADTNNTGHCVAGSADGPRGGARCCADATGRPRFERMCDDPRRWPAGEEGKGIFDVTRCLVCLDRDRQFFHEAGGFWGYKGAADAKPSGSSSAAPTSAEPAWQRRGVADSAEGDKEKATAEADAVCRVGLAGSPAIRRTKIGGKLPVLDLKKGTRKVPAGANSTDTVTAPGAPPTALQTAIEHKRDAARIVTYDGDKGKGEADITARALEDGRPQGGLLHVGAQ